MAVVQTNDELLEDPPGLLLYQPAVGTVAHGVVEQVPPSGILHDDGQVGLCQKHLHHQGRGMDARRSK